MSIDMYLQRSYLFIVKLFILSLFLANVRI